MQITLTVMLVAAVKKLVFISLHLLVIDADMYKDLLIRLQDWPVVSTYYVPGLEEPEACPLTTKGQGILVENVYFVRKYCTCQSIGGSSSTDTVIRRSVRRECNGKARCALSRRFIPSTVNCSGCSELADSLKIDYTCRHFSVDNSRVFNMSNEFVHQPLGRAPTSLILTSYGTLVHKSCKVSGENVRLTLLYVDFGVETNEGRITVDNDNTSVTAFNWINQPERTVGFTVNKSVINVYMIKGLMWMEVLGGLKTTVSCNSLQVQQRATDQGDVKFQVQYVSMPVYFTVTMAANCLLALCVAILSIALCLYRSRSTSPQINLKHTYNSTYGRGQDPHNYQRCNDTERVNSTHSKLTKSGGTYCEVGHDQWSFTELHSSRTLPSVFIDPMSCYGPSEQDDQLTMSDQAIKH
ncbi:hypothetical protein Btru_001730 [Bulinus truncatus]|nr:hypothetical protein Btru_001730 [Bulinus truncatus]